MRFSVVASLVAAALCAGLATPADARSHWPQPAAGPSRSGDPEVIFTFDDGPHEDTTPQILDALARHHVHALFLWTGWRVTGSRPVNDRRRALVDRAVAEGHMVGNHTVHHAHLCTVPKADAEAEIDQNASIYAKLTGLPMRFLRVPYGDRCRRLDDMLAARDLHHLHWDMDPLEWEPTATTASTRDYLIEKIRHLQGRAVVLMHDTKYDSAKAFPQVLDWIDAENQRRAAAGERLIRVLSYADLAREQIPPAVQEFVDERLAIAAALVPELLGHLVAPLAGLPAQVAHASNP